MPLPDRPVSGATIDSVWGQTIHDYTFAPAGCRVYGAAAIGAGSGVYNQLDLDTAVADPGGYLDASNDRVEIPTGGDGLYSLTALFDSANGVDGEFIRCAVYINGSRWAVTLAQCETGATVNLALAFHQLFTAGDIITVAARKSGGSANARCAFLSLVRLGAEYGAP